VDFEPTSATRRCHELVSSSGLRVRCPGPLPRARRWRARVLDNRRCEYLVDINAMPSGRLAAYHVLAGGRCGAFSLAVTRGRWPARLSRYRDLRLIGLKGLRPGQTTFERVPLSLLRRARVDGRPGLLLKAAPFPTGGVHGGHIAVVWNQGDAGYAISIHFLSNRRSSQGERRAAVLRAAQAMAD
jgi:hypothetical protein